MKNLILIRHSKSSWEVPLKDFDRHLHKRGINDAHEVSSTVLNYLPKTFIIWSSAAARASQTALIFAQNFAYPIDSIVYKEELYTFDDRQLEREIKSIDNSFESVIIFGHNEAITNFVNKFGDITVTNVPTSGFVSLQFPQNNWSDIVNGKTLKMIFPQDLK